MTDQEFEAAMLKAAAAGAAGTAATVADKVWDFNKMTKGFVERGLGSVSSEAGKQLVQRMFRPTLGQQLLDPRSGMIPKALVLGGGAAGIAAGAQAVDRYMDERKRGPEALQKNIAKMISRFPEVADIDPKDIQDSMTTLQTFSPTAASDPLAAASYVKRYNMYKDEGVHPSDLKTLAEAGRNVIDQGKMEPNKSISPITRSFQNALMFAE